MSGSPTRSSTSSSYSSTRAATPDSAEHPTYRPMKPVVLDTDVASLSLKGRLPPSWASRPYDGGHIRHGRRADAVDRVAGQGPATPCPGRRLAGPGLRIVAPDRSDPY